jgi:dipeptidase D
MNYVVKDRYPISLFNFFEEICSIPHGSGNESGIAEYLCKFAEERSLEYVRDSLNNVFIKKPAYTGYEDRPAVMLQAHTDMVCEKLPESTHDFLTDPLKLAVNGDMLTATGTTLGADNGIGVAAMLAALDDKALEAPALECLFTVSEETGMDGVQGFDFSLTKARNVVNLDNEGEGIVCCGCAGGIDVTYTLPCEYSPKYGKTVIVSVGDLAGGHSGVDIDLGRQNAIKLLSKALLSLYQTTPFCLVTMKGGAKPNVIPSSATAVMTFFGTAEAKAADKYLRSWFNEAKQNFCKADKKFRYSFKNLSEEAEAALVPSSKEFPKAQLTYKSTHRLLSLLAAAPSGVLKYMPDDKSQVLSSVNEGVLTHDGDKFTLIFFARSCFDCEYMETVSTLVGLGKAYGAETKVSAPHPGWKYVRGGALQKAYDQACREVLGKPAVYQNIHAGLECGAIITAMNRVDGAENAQAISIGPNLHDIHSVKEAVELTSCEHFYKIIAEILKKI